MSLFLSTMLYLSLSSLQSVSPSISCLPPSPLSICSFVCSSYMTYSLSLLSPHFFNLLKTFLTFSSSYFSITLSLISDAHPSFLSCHSHIYFLFFFFPLTLYLPYARYHNYNCSLHAFLIICIFSFLGKFTLEAWIIS